MKIYDKFEQLVGNTPLFEIKNIKKTEKLFARILVKLEYLNPAGSIKDRASLFMINDALISGVIKEGATVIEATSGNTGIGLSAIGASMGLNVVLTMPENMSAERIKILKAYGAKIVLTDATKGMKGAIEKAKEININTPNSFICSQFENASNTLSHYQTTAQEIWDDTDGNFDYLVAGIGSGGTISGIGKFIKQKNSKIKVVGVEPKDSPLISMGQTGEHNIQGIGANFVPKNYDAGVVDEVRLATEQSAIMWAKALAKKEGLLVGISSGAALSVAIELAGQEENENKTIVVILPDGADRYYSTKLFE